MIFIDCYKYKDEYDNFCEPSSYYNKRLSKNNYDSMLDFYEDDYREEQDY